MAVAMLLANISICHAEKPPESNPELADASLEELMQIEVHTVYGASRFEQKTTEAPATVTIVTGDEIKKYGYRTLADVLRSVPGFFVTYDRNYTYVGTRGFGPPDDYNTRILLLVDGHRVNDNIYDQAVIGTEFPVDMDLIDRVEIIRGPGSSLYGSNAFFGTINVILKRGRNFQGAEVSGAAGSYNTYNGRFSYGKIIKSGPEILLSGSIMNSEGRSNLYFKAFDDPATNNGMALHADYDKSYSFLTKISFKDLTLEGAFVSREKGIPTGSFGAAFNDPRNRTIDQHGFVDLRYSHIFENQLEVTARGFYDYFDYDGDYVYDRANPGNPPLLLINKDYSRGRWVGGEVLLSKELIARHRVSLGAEYRYNIRQDQGNYDSGPFFQYLDDKRRSDVWAVFMQDEYSILDNLILNAGVRHDQYSTFGGTTNPRLALIYKPLGKTVLKFLFGRAFRAPNAYESFYDDGGISMKKNPLLRPENLTDYELVYEQYIGEHFMSSLTGFYERAKDLIISQQDPADGLLVYRNGGQFESRGVELSIEGKWSNGLTGQASYTYQDVKDLNTGTSPVNSPKHLVKYKMIVPLVEEKVFAGAEVQYTSPRKTLLNNTTGGFFTTSLTLFSQNILKDLEVSASVYNLLDKKYGDPAGPEQKMDVIEQDGRTFRIKLTYRF